VRAFKGGKDSCAERFCHSHPPSPCEPSIRFAKRRLWPSKDRFASDALGAAASAAAGVVLERVSAALGSGQKKVDEALAANCESGVRREFSSVVRNNALLRAKDR
jgi:hypothetical protein